MASCWRSACAAPIPSAPGWCSWGIRPSCRRWGSPEPGLRHGQGLSRFPHPCGAPSGARAAARPGVAGRGPSLPPTTTAGSGPFPEGMVALLERQEWLGAAQEALRRSAACDNPDLARILCYTNRTLEALVPIARRALHGEMADQLPVLPGEVLITRMAVMAPACGGGEEGAEEPDMVLGSNRELQVRDVTPERCDLADFGVSCGDDEPTPVIETLTARCRPETPSSPCGCCRRSVPGTASPSMGCWSGCVARPGRRGSRKGRAVAPFLSGARRLRLPGAGGRAHGAPQPGQHLFRRCSWRAMCSCPVIWNFAASWPTWR
jgi:hypothetical protein